VSRTTAASSYAGSYARVRAPRPTVFDASSPVPARYLARLLDAELNHGMPAQRRLGRVLSAAGRRRLPTRLMGQLVRVRRRRPRPDLDDLLGQVAAAWPDLAARTDRLPATAPLLGCALVERSAVDMVFVFGEGELPLLVLKRALGERSLAGLQRERAALVALAGHGLAPLHLGEVGGHWVQEALPGLPLRLSPVRPGNAPTLLRPAPFADLDRALEGIAALTARPGPPPETLVALLGRAAAHPLSPTAGRAVASAIVERERLGVTVLQHQDVSAQNWIVDGQQLSGLIDWETCSPTGTPGIDSVEAAVSVLEHGIALERWSDELVVEVFGPAWESSAYFEGTREATARAVQAAGLAAGLAEPFTVAYFAGRLGRKLAEPASQSLGAGALAAMLETVARSFS
jgi:hypothetical protein